MLLGGRDFPLVFFFLKTRDLWMYASSMHKIISKSGIFSLFLYFGGQSSRLLFLIRRTVKRSRGTVPPGRDIFSDLPHKRTRTTRLMSLKKKKKERNYLSHISRTDEPLTWSNICMVSLSGSEVYIRLWNTRLEVNQCTLMFGDCTKAADSTTMKSAIIQTWSVISAFYLHMLVLYRIPGCPEVYSIN